MIDINLMNKICLTGMIFLFSSPFGMAFTADKLNNKKLFKLFQFICTVSILTVVFSGLMIIWGRE